MLSPASFLAIYALTVVASSLNSFSEPDVVIDLDHEGADGRGREATEMPDVLALGPAVDFIPAQEQLYDPAAPLPTSLRGYGTINGDEGFEDVLLEEESILNAEAAYEQATQTPHNALAKRTVKIDRRKPWQRLPAQRTWREGCMMSPCVYVAFFVVVVGLVAFLAYMFSMMATQGH